MHPWSTLRELVIVAGHAIYVAPHFQRPLDDSSWVLAPHQRGEAPHYLEHIRCGVELAAARPSALLLFSGGQTRRSAGPRSEAQSYWMLAEHFQWWGQDVAERCSTEEFARDSFENLAFSLQRFQAVCGKAPQFVELVSWAFKQERFQHHARTLGIENRFRFIGQGQVDGTGQAPNQQEVAQLAEACLGEVELALEPFLRDPRGEGQVLRPTELPLLIAAQRFEKLEPAAKQQVQRLYAADGPLGAWQLQHNATESQARTLRDALHRAGYRSPSLADKRAERDPFLRGPSPHPPCD
ncbi:MAG: hypothetical protein RBU37_08355 [Myxococcota bacterium]|jgi:hypothetical protein|nr:hypothetical protein [Myxococcota bacterium]